MTHRQSYYQRDEDKLEGVQRSAAKMIRELEGLMRKKILQKVQSVLFQACKSEIRIASLA